MKRVFNAVLTVAAAAILCGACATAEKQAEAPASKPAETTTPATVAKDAKAEPAAQPAATTAPAAAPAAETAATTAPSAGKAAQKADLGKFETVYFDFDKSDIRPEFRDNLAKEAELLKESGAKLVIEGHCDERGTEEYNLALGDRRAASVKKYWTSLGVGAASVNTISYGEEKPVDSGHGEAAWKKNRRAQFVPATK